MPIVDPHVVTSPLLDKKREECCTETEDEGREPYSVYADDGGRWYVRGERIWRGEGDRDLGIDGGDLLGNLSKKDRMLSEVIVCFVCRVGLQVLLAVEYESGEGGGE